jgi:hypothetical protein
MICFFPQNHGVGAANANHYHLHSRLGYFRYKKTQILIRVFWHDYCLEDFYDNDYLQSDCQYWANGSDQFHLEFEAEKFRLVLWFNAHRPSSRSFARVVVSRILARITAS